MDIWICGGVTRYRWGRGGMKYGVEGGGEEGGEGSKKRSTEYGVEGEDGI